MVLRVTVFPPVFGPVTTKVEKSFPSLTLMGTTFLRSIRGCLACFSSRYPSSSIFGSSAFIREESLPLAKITSRSVRMVWLLLSSLKCSATFPESSIRIRSISACSLSSSSLKRLLASTTACGSINKVEPEPDWSCTIPGTLALCSALTGTTYLPSLMVIIASCR